MTEELRQATLDAATFERLFADLTEHAEVLGISAKGGAAAYAGGEGLDLATAREALRAGTVRGVQIRYRYDGDEWWDTLLTVDGTIRLVRVRPDFDEAVP